MLNVLESTVILQTEHEAIWSFWSASWNLAFEKAHVPPNEAVRVVNAINKSELAPRPVIEWTQIELFQQKIAAYVFSFVVKVDGDPEKQNKKTIISLNFKNP